MKASPLILRDVTFLRLRVEINREYKGRATGYDFDGTLHRLSIRHGKTKDDAQDWWVGVEFAAKSGDEKPCPYDIDVLAIGLFGVSENIPEERCEKLVYENGAALVFGAIREMVTTVTGRCSYGAMMLPTASFVGDFAKYKEELEKVKPEETDVSA